jgi:oligopeptide transport system substrate-binding protein
MNRCYFGVQNKIVKKGEEMKNTVRMLLALLLIAVLTGSLVACSTGTTKEGGEAGGEVAQELVFALQNEPDGIDPNVTNNSFASTILMNCFEGLVTYSTEDGSLQPGLAESWEISEDLLTYTFHMRAGLKWSDGTALNAGDFYYSMFRMLDPATASVNVSSLTDYIAGSKEYYDALAEGKTPSAEDVGLKLIDDNTIEFTINKPKSYFVNLLGSWYYFAVQQATVEANGDRWTASANTYVTNGPFMVSEINLGESYVLVKNPNYYDADKVKLEKLTLRFIPDLATSLSAYESGEIQGQLNVPPTDVARLKTDPDSGLLITQAYGSTYYDINVTKAPYDNVLVRKALSLAVDRDKIIDILKNYGTPSYAISARG